MYAAKAVPTCLLAAVVPFPATGVGPGLCLSGATRREPQVGTSSVAAVVPIVVAVMIW